MKVYECEWESAFRSWQVMERKEAGKGVQIPEYTRPNTRVTPW